ncbi:MAG TPA: inositol monophosphatase family protein [Verrucomicrobiae bacterium]|jgi:myo-inositol-1(or 4)-monophosphatase|nr:inositol monophosphatase family protein [Verrucomicrobiae bacterium]
MIEEMKKAALKAGEFMRSSTERGSTEKSNAKDFVTVADIKSQDILREELGKAFPSVIILSEEDSEEARRAMYADGFTGFILDPIDGTYNFKRDMRESAISVGYIKNGEPLAGVIYDPYKEELFEAEKGKGAFKNGKPISVSTQSDLAGASIATSNSYDDKAMERNLRRHLAIYEATGTMPWTSCPGSGVLILAWVACGRIDAYHHNGLKPWDNAAAFLLVREAGGTVHSLSGTTDALFTESAMVAGGPAITETLEAVFSQMSPELLQ